MAEPPSEPEQDTILASPRRRLILQLIEEDPGVHVSDLHLALDTGAGAFYHHLRKLEEAGLVEIRRVSGGRRRLYPAGKAPPQGRESDPLFSEVAQQVARCLIQQPGASSAQIMAKTGLAERTVQTHLKRLVESGLATDARDGRHITYRPTARLLRAWGTRP